MLRKIRTALALVLWTLITWLLVDFTGTAQAYLGWLAKIQLMPALLAVNVGALLFLAALTLLMGRVYCSVICPLGVMMDAVARLRRKRNKYSYSPPRDGLRHSMLALCALFLVANTAWLAGLLLPYSTYGRLCAAVLAPLYKLGNNALAAVAEHYGSYAVYGVDVWLKSAPALAVALVSWAVIAALAWRGGRTWCNTVCPAGTLLGLLARRAALRPEADNEKCNGCGRCSRNCKASCIDPATRAVDMSRCVVCGDCVSECPQGAITWRAAGRLTSTALLAGAALLKAKDKRADGGLAVIEDKRKPRRQRLITPPGSLSARNLRSRCTACQLCVDSCPNDVLRPSSSLDRLMQPEVSYERGYCRPECDRCSQVCPTGAIQPVTAEERTAIQVGRAVWTPELCLPQADGVPCGNCARHCPAGAIQMVPLHSGVHRDGDRWLDADNNEIPAARLLLIPAVNEEKCIGCGACEYLCPARPLSAIHVEGNEVHREV